jgi:hypothetical protein
MRADANHARLLGESAVAEVMGDDILGQGNPGSPGSGGASPYLSRSKDEDEHEDEHEIELGAIWKGEGVASQAEGCDVIFPAHTA